MKLLTLNFLTCARKACKQEPAAFPLHPRDAELERVEQEVNPEFLVNVLPRLDWKAIRSLSEEVSLLHLPPPPLTPQTPHLKVKERMCILIFRTQIARPPHPPRTSTRVYRFDGSNNTTTYTNTERFTSIVGGNECCEWEIGLWTLWTRVCC